jgi:hypothetical protein
MSSDKKAGAEEEGQETGSKGSSTERFEEDDRLKEDDSHGGLDGTSAEDLEQALQFLRQHFPDSDLENDEFLNGVSAGSEAGKGQADDEVRIYPTRI